MRARDLRAAAAIVIAITVLLAVPFYVSAYWVTVMTNILMLAVLAQSWNIITGFAGYPAFGNIAFFGVGAYSMGLLTSKYSTDLPYLACVMLCGLIAAVACVIFGSPLMRVRGHYFAIGTIGLAVAFREATYVIPQLTTDVAGTITLPAFPRVVSSIEVTAYLWMLAALVVCVAVTVWISRGRVGFGLRAIRADEDAAATFGVATFKLKMTAWSISAFFCGVVGGVWATWIAVVTPSSAYDLNIAVQYSVMALIGGLGTVIGPLVGAFAVGLVTNLVWEQYPSTHFLVLGIIVMLTVLVLPEGLVSIRRTRPWRSLRRLSSVPRRGISTQGENR